MGGIIQARAGEILKFGAKREGKGKKRKRKRAPQVYRLEQKAARAAGTLTEGDLEATWELRKRQCFGAVSERWAVWEGNAPAYDNSWRAKEQNGDEGEPGCPSRQGSSLRWAGCAQSPNHVVFHFRKEEGRKFGKRGKGGGTC